MSHLKTSWRVLFATILFSMTAGLFAQNSAPEFLSEPSLIAVPDFEYVYDAAAMDPDRDAISFSATGLPAWLTLDPQNTTAYFSDGWSNHIADNIQKLVQAPNGKLWFWQGNNNTLQKMDPDGSNIEDVNTDLNWVNALSFGADGTLYVMGNSNDGALNGLSKLHPDSSQFELMNSDVGCNNQYIAIADDGSVWQSDNCYNRLRHYAADTTTFEDFTISESNNMRSIAIHPDGTIWFTEENWDGKIKSFDPSDSTVTTVFQDENFHNPREIMIDGNGAVVVFFSSVNNQAGLYHLNGANGPTLLTTDWGDGWSGNPATGDIWGDSWSQIYHFQAGTGTRLYGTPVASDHGEYAISLSADDGQGNTTNHDFTLMVDSTVVFYSMNMDSNLTDPANWDYVSEGLVLGWTKENCTCDGCTDVNLINYVEDTCHQWSDSFAGVLGSPTGTRWSRSSTDSSSIDDYQAYYYWHIKEASNDGKSVSMWDETANKMYDIQPVGEWPDQWQASQNGDDLAYYRIGKGDGYAVNPSIVSITDVPEDQGGRVYLTFAQSAWDTDELPGRSTESYTIQRKDGDTWVGLTSIGTYGSDEYVVEVSTLNDSTSNGDNAAEFRVIANMDEGNFVSVVGAGHSVDNIAPGTPDDLAGEIVDGAGELTWAASTANDLAHYKVYRGATADFVSSTDSFVGESASSNYTDSEMAGGDNYYAVTAVDVHDNESDPSATFALTGGTNSAPVLADISDQSFDEDGSLDITLSATDSNGDGLSFSASSDQTDVQVSVSNDVLSIMASDNWNGSATITVEVSDGSLSDNTTFVLTVAAVNDAPSEFTLSSPHDATIDIMQSNMNDTLWFAWTPSQDVDGDQLTYSIDFSTEFAFFQSIVTINDDATAYALYADIASAVTTHGIQGGDWQVTVSDGSESVSAENGPYSFNINTTTLAVDNNAMPQVFALHQNYPNPFNPSTTLQYDLAEESFVRVTIYDIMGHRIKTLVNTQQNAGFKSVVWDATNNLNQPVGAGMYLYRITAGNNHQMKKMVLLK